LSLKTPSLVQRNFCKGEVQSARGAVKLFSFYCSDAEPRGQSDSGVERAQVARPDRKN
jgi:hypothetical protein